MDEKKTEKKTEVEQGAKISNCRIGIVVDGELFPFSMTVEEHDAYLKLLEEEKSSKQ